MSENLQITCPTFNESLDRFGNLVVDFLPIVEELKLNIGQAFETAEIKISEQVHEYDCELINLENKVTLITKDLNPLLEKLKGLAEMQQLKKKLEEQDEYIKEIQLIREEKIK